MKEVHINTLTQEQKKDIEKGYKYVINDKNKLERIGTIETDKLEIQEEFEKAIKSITDGYSQSEIDSWSRKIEEAKKIIAGETSAFISALCIEGETELELSNKIIEKSEAYKLAYANAEKIKRERLKQI